MRNDETGAIRQYHELTKHSVESLQAGPRGLDWTNQPIPFKIYLDVERFPLPRDLSAGEVSMLSALAASGELSPPPPDPIHVDLFALARVLYFSAGITKVRRHGDAATYFRAAPNTGALYHIDVYVICRDLDGLPAGVYHFDPRDFTLGRLREGDYRGLIVQATAAEPTVATAPVVLATASTYWRNAWKYRARAWRHAFWDGGTLQANLLAVAAALGLRPRVVLGFVDRDIEHLLGLDPGREGALSLVPLGRDPEAPAPVDALEDLDLRTERLSPQEIEYPEIVAAQEASSLETPDRVASWRDAVPAREVPAAAGRTFPLRPLTVSEWPQDPLEQVIRRRGSTRRFDASRPLGFEGLSTVLDLATRPVPADFLEEPGASLIDLYLIVHAVEDLPSGVYRLRRNEGELELLREGDFRPEAGRLGLFQELPADAAVNVYCLADLDPILSRFGNRGYRGAQLEGAICGGRLYLAAYALGVGASGLTFLDDEVIEFLDADDLEVMFLTVLGYAHPSLLRRR